jgi:hypothetical protein
MFQSKGLIIIYLTVFIFAFSALQLDAQQVVKVSRTYSPGYYGQIEFKRANEDEWKPIQAGIQLTGDDWIRMPPASILRLEPFDEGELPAFTGGQMRTVGQFLLLAKDPDPPAAISSTGDPVSVGAMPKAADISEQTPKQEERQKLSVTKESLQRLLALAPEKDDEKLAEVLQDIQVKPPYQKVPNLGKALWIFDLPAPCRESTPVTASNFGYPARGCHRLCVVVLRTA